MDADFYRRQQRERRSKRETASLTRDGTDFTGGNEGNGDVERDA